MYATQGRLTPQETQGFKSKLEYITSKWLTKICNLKVSYEPFTYKTKIGNYTPDFWCEETNQYFECKPNLEFAAIKLYQQFCDEKNADLIIITSEGIFTIENWDRVAIKMNHSTNEKNWLITPDEGEAIIINCPKCNLYSFGNIAGIWACRKCGYHNGASIRNNANETNLPYISFGDYYNSFKNKKGFLVVE